MLADCTRGRGVVGWLGDRWVIEFGWEGGRGVCEEVLRPNGLTLLLYCSV